MANERVYPARPVLARSLCAIANGANIYDDLPDSGRLTWLRHANETMRQLADQDWILVHSSEIEQSGTDGMWFTAPHSTSTPNIPPPPKPDAA